MERCANTEALNRHLDNQERQEIAREELFKLLENELEEHRIIVAKIQETAKDYKGFDFTEDINDELMGDI